MPEIEIRPASAEDIPYLVAIEHNYKSNYVMQMDLNTEEGQINVNFREIRLPRQVHVEYPHPARQLQQDWMKRSAVLVAVLEGEPVGYLSLSEQLSPASVWVSDLAVSEKARRKGIATALVLAAQEWAAQRGARSLVMEMQSKNHAAIRLAQKLAFEFCGYNDHYYANQDLGVFFASFLR
ncbi:MAG: GNAT family N-acetyltransferase [Anaerolineaceae bacterium]